MFSEGALTPALSRGERELPRFPRAPGEGARKGGLGLQGEAFGKNETALVVRRFRAGCVLACRVARAWGSGGGRSGGEDSVPLMLTEKGAQSNMQNEMAGLAGHADAGRTRGMIAASHPEAVAGDLDAARSPIP